MSTKTVKRLVVITVLVMLTVMALVGVTSRIGDGDPPYFKRGVYVNYSADAKSPDKHYFYVFDNFTDGHTDDGNVGIGCPFSCTQKNGKVLIRFGGDDEPKEILYITDVKGGLIHGYYDGLEDHPLVFEYLADVDPAYFDAEEYLNS